MKKHHLLFLALSIFLVCCKGKNFIKGPKKGAKYIEYKEMDTTVAKDMIVHYKGGTVTRTDETMPQMISFDMNTMKKILQLNPYADRMRLFLAAYPSGAHRDEITVLVQLKRTTSTLNVDKYTYYDLSSEAGTAFDCLCPPPPLCDIAERIWQ